MTDRLLGREGARFDRVQQLTLADAARACLAKESRLSASNESSQLRVVLQSLLEVAFLHRYQGVFALLNEPFHAADLLVIRIFFFLFFFF